jgi:Fic family protein
MADWIRAARDLEANADHFPERAAELHSTFERVHPFLDGNGRVGRLVLNLLLIRLGYPPAIIYKRDRERYMGALRRADRGEPG